MAMEGSLLVMVWRVRCVVGRLDTLLVAVKGYRWHLSDRWQEACWHGTCRKDTRRLEIREAIARLEGPMASWMTSFQVMSRL